MCIYHAVPLLVVSVVTKIRILKQITTFMMNAPETFELYL